MTTDELKDYFTQVINDLEEKTCSYTCSVDEKSRLRDKAITDTMAASSLALEARMELSRKHDIDLMAQRMISRHTTLVIITAVISAVVGAVFSHLIK